jgi:dTDP-4-amino-4,6-dideoxygalactose transaminase
MLTKEVLCLPLYPELPFEDIARVADAVRTASAVGAARA